MPRKLRQLKPTAARIKVEARKYLKVVEWSKEDGCYIGSAPPIIGQCCHGGTEANVMAQLAVVVEEWVESLLTDGKPLPAATANKDFSGKFLVRISPDLHKKAALKALARGESLNQFVAEAIASA
jgi:predicted RNase H-like HicB family nuclease